MNFFCRCQNFYVAADVLVCVLIDGIQKIEIKALTLGIPGIVLRFFVRVCLLLSYCYYLERKFRIRSIFVYFICQICFFAEWITIKSVQRK